MVAKLTTEEFIKRAKEVHGNRYDYSKTKYIKTTLKLNIICKKHGNYQITGHSHLRGTGCPICSDFNNRELEKNKFIKHAKKIHGTKYDYSKVVYHNVHTNVDIICPEHGKFKQLPMVHVQGKGNCPICAGNKKSSTAEFIEKANKIHNNIYDYSQVNYISNKIKINIICPEHGIFIQAPNRHLYGDGCPICFGKKQLTTGEFIKKAKEVHGDKYDYSKVNYVDTFTKINIICPIHGIFLQTPNMHICMLNGCPICGGTKKLTTEEFIKNAKEIHGNKYDYSKVLYTINSNHIDIICKEHGVFSQTPNMHTSKELGCPKCSIANISSLETKLSEFFKENYPDLKVIERDRKLLSKCGKGNMPLELDFYIPSKNIAIELHGNYWHSEKIMDYNRARTHIFEKFKLCLDRDIQLLQFYEDEVENKFDTVTNIIKHKLGLTTDRTYARKLKIIEIDKKIAKDFLDTYHLQGKTSAKVSYGLIDNTNNLLSVMSFSYTASNRGTKADPTKWELVRFASKGSIVGGAAKLLAHFIRNHPECEEIVSYSDNRISDGGLYETLGFEIAHIVPPDYYYIISGDCSKKRYHKSALKKQNQAKLFTEENGYIPFDSSLTEYVNANRNGFYRIWNAGLVKWVLK